MPPVMLFLTQNGTINAVFFVKNPCNHRITVVKYTMQV